MNKKKRCLGCNKLFEKRLLSRKGYCFQCGAKNMFESRQQMKDKKGPHYEKWKAGYIKGMSKYLLNMKHGKKS